MDESYHTIGEVARRAHVTVRTLHHYDSIGLLVPPIRSPAGYRLYSDTELRRLHEIMLYRELGLPLEAIQRLLDAPAPHRGAALRAQRELLDEKLRRTEAVLRALDAAIATLEGDTEMHRDHLFEGFDDFDHAPYADEARERWGDTDAYQESARRTRSYSASDWERMRAEMDAVEAELARLLAAGASPRSDDAMAAAEGHRQLIERWFYPCDSSMHRSLGEMYLADPRFRAHYDDRAAGLAEYLTAAIEANAAR